mgnify:CR=1 FL=1
MHKVNLFFIDYFVCKSIEIFIKQHSIMVSSKFINNQIVINFVYLIFITNHITEVLFWKFMDCIIYNASVASFCFWINVMSRSEQNISTGQLYQNQHCLSCNYIIREFYIISHTVDSWIQKKIYWLFLFDTRLDELGKGDCISQPSHYRKYKHSQSNHLILFPKVLLY